MPARMPSELGAPAKKRNKLAARDARSRSPELETQQEKVYRACRITACLDELYSDVECPLTYRNNFELLVAVILSAQCTDAAVNKVTPRLFARFPDSMKLSNAPLAEIEAYILSLGLYHAKAKSLKKCAEQLVERFNGMVPSSMVDLTSLAGVGRKTANVIRGHAFGEPGIAVDTHCRRVSRRLGLTRHEDPQKIERDLARILPTAEWTKFSHRLILHGRRVCFARRPACPRCSLNPLCPSANLVCGQH
jgi:endonuclease-3